jgi:hypothetical protein
LKPKLLSVYFLRKLGSLCQIKTFTLVKAAFHAQFKKAMELRGITASHYFKKFKLPVEIHDPESLLPLKPFFQLINILAIDEEMSDFGSFVAQTTPWHQVMSLGPLIERSKNLESLLRTFCDIASSQSSLVKFTLADEVTGHYFCSRARRLRESLSLSWWNRGNRVLILPILLI